MKRAIAVCAVLLSGCAYNATLYPKGGGDVASGVYQHGGRSMEVTVKGVTYSGDVTQGTSTGMAFRFSPTFAATPMLMQSNQFSSVMTNGGRAVRCEFAVAGNGGNGICVDSEGLGYDLVLKMQ